MKIIKSLKEKVKFRIARVIRCFAVIKHQITRCKKWKTCVELTWNQEWTLCGNRKCKLVGYNSLTRAYKKTIGTYKIEEDVLIPEGERQNCV